jgi:hypothetical protein
LINLLTKLGSIENEGSEGIPAQALSSASRASSPAVRGRELREDGFSVLRTFRVLKREFPHVERHELWVAAGADLGTGWPLWADRSSPKPASIRNDPRR